MNQAKKPLILVCNDDGITANGIRVLTEEMCQLDAEVVVVAPDSPQSGMGHAITINEPLKIHKSQVFSDLGVEAYACSGTPVDCIKLAKHHILFNRPPDLIVSGVNHGSNSSISILYSGTMSAAIEGAIEGAPAIGFSLCEYGHDADFSHTRPFVRAIAAQVLETSLPRGTALNVNIPAKSAEPPKGVKICRQARAKWQEDFDERIDPYGRSYFWLVGDFVNFDKGEDTDVWALGNNYVSVVPCVFDLTAHHAISILNNEWKILD
ncbi:MAG: 5'/3'-nucleotidase SurE [Bernardetiaceae bacterium]